MYYCRKMLFLTFLVFVAANVRAEGETQEIPNDMLDPCLEPLVNWFFADCGEPDEDVIWFDFATLRCLPYKKPPCQIIANTFGNVSECQETCISASSERSTIRYHHYDHGDDDKLKAAYEAFIHKQPPPQVSVWVVPKMADKCLEPLVNWFHTDCPNKEEHEKYWFDVGSMSCKTFKKPSCQRVRNTFDSLEDCEKHCKFTNSENLKLRYQHYIHGDDNKLVAAYDALHPNKR